MKRILIRALFIMSATFLSAQNIALTASSLKLASIVQYTLKPSAVSESLKLTKDETPLFMQQLGYPE